MLISIGYKKKVAGSKYINSYSIRKMTHFTPCGVKRVRDPFSSAGVREKIICIGFILESKVSIYNVSMDMQKIILVLI
jgi:hypothetical protein